MPPSLTCGHWRANGGEVPSAKSAPVPGSIEWLLLFTISELLFRIARPSLARMGGDYEAD